MDIAKFKNIPTIYRPAPFWSWNDKLDKEELCRQIDEMADKGWGSYFMHSRVGLVTGYLTPEWFELINACAKKAGETGTYAWLYDEDKWPSGFAGGEVAQTYEFRSRALVLLEEGQATENDQILTTVVHNGTSYSIAKRVSPLGNKWFNRASYVDLMNPNAVKKFIECTHERYKKHCGRYFGKEIPGIFTDEPCYLMQSHYDVPVMPWSDYLPEFFNSKKGYEITEHLSELFFNINNYQKVRYDFFDTASELFLESFTKQYYKWCSDNNLIMTGHLMAEDYLNSQTQWIGSAMPHYEFFHWPGIDKLGRNTKHNITVKQVTSVAEQLGKERCFSEVFGCIGQQSAFRERKWIADWEAVLGISFVNHHLSLYSMRGERKRDYPANLFYQQPWWEDEKTFSDYIGRLCEIAADGKRDAKILVIHPIGSAWSVYSPTANSNNGFFEPLDNTKYDMPFELITNLLIEENLDFHYGDETILQRHASIKNGSIKVGDYEYTAVVVPPSFTLRQNTLDLLSKFNGQLIFVRPFPTRIDGNEASEIIPSSAIKTTSVAKAVDLLKNTFADRVKTTDKISGKNAKKLICCVKEDKGDKIVLFANSEDAREINAKIEIKESRTPYMLDLASGDVFNVPHISKDGKVFIDAKFYFAGSLALWFTDNPVNALPSAVAIDTGVSFSDSFEVMAEAIDYKTSLQEQNVLPVNTVTLFMNGNKVLDNEPIAKAWHEHFYNAEDGTPFSAEYRFYVKDIPDGELFAVIECANNLDCITLNGKEIAALRNRNDKEVFNPNVNYKDVNYIKVPITGLVQNNENIIRITGKKINNVTGSGSHQSVKDFKTYNSTEVEAIYIIGDFTVEGRNNTSFCISKAVPNPIHNDITASGCPFYAGKALIKCNAYISDIKGNAYIRLNGVKAACAKVFVNGSLIACKYMNPYIFDATDYIKQGNNDIAIEIAGTLFNLTGPNWIKGILDNEFVSPYTFIDFSKYTEQYTLMPFGIDGVDIVCEQIK